MRLLILLAGIEAVLCGLWFASAKQPKTRQKLRTAMIVVGVPLVGLIALLLIVFLSYGVIFNIGQ